MVVYRIAREKYHKDISGTGSRIHGGRWNYKGISVLYTSESRALSTLEYLVHVDHDLIPPDLKLLSIEIPMTNDEVLSVSAKKLPKNWMVAPPPEILKRIGQESLFDQNRLAVKIPSVIIPDEFNLIINPQHKDFKSVRIIKIQSYKLI